MAEGRQIGWDALVVILLTAVMVTGFWMTSKVSDEKGELLQHQVGLLNDTVKSMAVQLAEIHNVVLEHKGEAAAAPTAAPAPAPTAAKPAKK